MANNEDWDGALRVTLGFSRFYPYESKGDYGEKDFVLRLWHPSFQDVHYVRSSDLARSKYTDDITNMRSVEFRSPFPENIDNRGDLIVRSDAFLGLNLYCDTANENGQFCVKYEGTFRDVSLADFKALTVPGNKQEMVYDNVYFVSEAMEGGVVSTPYRHVSSGRKAFAKRMAVTLSVHKCIVRIKDVDVSLSPKNFDYASKKKLDSFVDRLVQYHMRVPICAEKLRYYYSVYYKIAPNLILPASAYMLQLTDPRGEKMSGEVVLELMNATIASHPELGDLRDGSKHEYCTALNNWLSVCNTYLDCTSDEIPAGKLKNGCDSVTFMDCLIVAMEVLSCEVTSEPYLLDMETDTYARTKTQYHTHDTAVVKEDTSGIQTAIPVERFASSLTEGYGPDCEDGGGFEYKLKHDIQSQFLSSSNNVLRTLARIYELFIAFHSHVACKGDDRQTVCDDGVYHHTLYMLPRMYVAECSMRSHDKKNIFSARTQNHRGWEKEYKKHMGVFIVEGTNTVCPAQFTFQDDEIQAIREDNTVAACCATGDMRDPKIASIIRLYHSVVYPQPYQLSPFYRWGLAAFSHEGDDKNILDYSFTSRNGTKGIRVEKLAEISDSVCVRPIIRYTDQVLELCKQVLSVYKYPPKVFVHIDEHTAHDYIKSLKSAIMTNKYISEMSAKPLPASIRDRRRYFRLDVQHLDLCSGHRNRPRQILAALEQAGRAVNCISIDVNVHVLGGTWCAAEDMSKTQDDVVHCLIKVSLTYYYE
jgi:hypothetical protein